MSFEEKSTALMLGILLLVYGWYFATVIESVVEGDVTNTGYQGRLIVTVFAVIILAIVGHIVIAAVRPGEAGHADERDRLIDLKGEWPGGFVLGTGVFAGIVLAVIEAEHFWIANALLLAMVLSEVTSSVAKLVLYRRMA